MEPVVALVAVLSLCLLATVAYLVRAMDAPGSLLSLCMGILVLFTAGLEWVLLLLLFAAGGTAASMLGPRRKARLTGDSSWHAPRGWRNVVGNGGVAVAVAAAAAVVPEGLLVVPFAVAVAVAAADTFASEVGTLSSRAVLITRPGTRVRPGADGGVSWLGSLAAVMAAAGVGLAAVAFWSLSWSAGMVVVAGGVAGSFLDSLLGALWESSPMRPRGVLSKTHVNLIATFVPTMLAFAVVSSL